MKSLKDIVIALIPITLLTYMFIWDFGNISYLKYLLSEARSSPERWIDLFKFFLIQLLTVFNIIAPIVYLATQNPAIKRKTYSLIRYITVIGFLFSIPGLIMQFRYMSDFSDWKSLLLWFRYLLLMFTAIVLWISKPEDEVPYISLENFELVSYTSRGHRLVHYLVDMLFVTTISFNWLSRSEEMAILSSLVTWANILIYYLLSELMFRQTLAKILTNSCVVAPYGNMNALRVTGRSFARLIPFDALSFLWNGDWHDRASGSTVVYINSWENIEFEGEEKSQA